MPLWLRMLINLVEQGAWNVVNFDGGGSATMVVCDEVVNTPTDGKERAVMDSFQGISLAPVDSTFSFVSFLNLLCRLYLCRWFL